MALGAFPVVLDFAAKYADRQAARRVAEDLGMVEKSARAAKSSFTQLAGSFTSMVVAKWAKQGIGAVLKPALEMDTTQKRLQAQTRATTAEMKKYNAAANKVAMTTPYGPIEVTDALLELTRATGSADESMKGLNAVTNLTMASMDRMTIPQATKAAAEIARTFGYGGDQLVKAADKMMAAAKSTGLGVEEYAQVMGRLGAANVQGAQSFEQVIQAYSLMRGGGWSAMRSTTMLIRMMSELGKGKASAAFENMGIKIKGANEKLRPFSDILGDVYDRFQKMPELVKQGLGDAFDTASQKGFITLLGRFQKGVFIQGVRKTGREAMKGIMDEMAKSAGAGEWFKQAYLGMASTQIALLKQSFENLAITVGQAVLPAIKTVAKSLAGMVNWVVVLVKKVPILGDVVKGLAIFTGIGAAVWAARLAMGGFLNIVSAVSARLPPLSLGLGSVARGLRDVAIGANGAREKMTSFASTVAGKMGSLVLTLGKAYVAYKALSALTDIADKGPRTWWKEQGAAAETEFTQKAFAKMQEKYGKRAAGITFETFQNELKRRGGGKIIGGAFNIMGGLKDMKGVFETLEKQKKSKEQQQKKEIEIQEKMKQTAQDWDQSFAFGYKSMDEILSRTEKLMKWKPPVIEWKAFRTAQNRVQAALLGGKLDKTSQREAKTLLYGYMPELIKLGQTARERQLTGPEYAKMVELTRNVYPLLADLETMGAIEKGTSATFVKKFGQPLAQWGTKENQQATQVKTVARGGVTPYETQTPGWLAAQGRLRGGPANPLLEGALGEVYGSKSALMQGPPEPGGGYSVGKAFGQMLQNTGLIRTLAEAFGKQAAEALRSNMPKQEPLQSDANYPFWRGGS